jgi:hypothetical protein
MRSARSCLCIRFALVAFALTMQSLAQGTLDLRPAVSAPEAGTGLAAPAMAQALATDADRLDREAEESAAARAAIRRFACELLRRGEAMGEAGSSRIVLGYTLAHAMEAIDGAISTLGSDDANARTLALGLLKSDAEDARAVLRDKNADAWRATRDALSTLTRDRSARSGGWPDAPGASDGQPVSLEAIRALIPKIPGGTEESRAAAEPLLALLAETDERAPASRIARHIRRRIGSIAQALADRPAWLAEPAASAAGGALLFSMPRLVSAEDRDSALATIDRLSIWCEIVTLAKPIGNDASAAKMRGAIAEIVPTATSGASREHLEGARSLVRAASASGGLADEKTLPRQARPAWHALAQSLRSGQDSLVAVLPEAIRSPNGLSNPAVLAPLGAQRRTLSDLRLLESFARRAGVPNAAPGAEPQIATPSLRLAERVLKYGQEMARPDRAGEAGEALRGLLSSLDRLESFPGEASLQAVVALGASDPERAAWDAIAGGRTAALRAEILSRRDSWLDAVRKGTAPKPDDLARLESLRELVGVLDAAAAAMPGANGRASPALAALQRWGGWELSDEARAIIVGDLAKDAAEATRLVLEGDRPASMTALARLRDRHAAALLMGRLARSLPREAKRTDGAAPSDAGAPANGARTKDARRGEVDAALGELGFGGPIVGASWMEEQAAAIADVCRYAEELAAIQRAIDTGSAPPKAPKPEELRRWIDERARGVLEAMVARTGEP